MTCLAVGAGARPVIMVGSVLRNDDDERDMHDQEQDDRRHAEEVDHARASSKPPNSQVSSWNWPGFQIASPDSTMMTPSASTPR